MRKAVLFALLVPALMLAQTDKGLQQAWSLDGAWSGGIASDENAGVLYAVSPQKIAEVELSGKIRRELPGAGSRIVRLAHFSNDGSPVLLAFSTWSQSVQAYDLNGVRLWSYATPHGIDDAWPIDLNGDKIDEVIIGLNGKGDNGGLQILDRNGKVQASYTGIGNVWHVSGGDVSGTGRPQVVTTSAAGEVHVFSADLTERKDLNPGFYANMVRVRGRTIFAIGSVLDSSRRVALTALSGDGVKKWSLQLPPGVQPSIESAVLASNKPWLALGMRGGQIFVVDDERGALIGSIDGQGSNPQVAWLGGKDVTGPLLIVSTPNKINAYRVWP